MPGAWGLFGDLIWSFMMPLFLLVSGYFAANAFTRAWSVVARTRLARFVYLYLLWSLIRLRDHGIDQFEIQRRGTNVPGVKKQPLRLGLRWIVEATNTWWSNYGQLRRNTDQMCVLT